MEEIYKIIENSNYAISNKGNLKYLGETTYYKSGIIQEVDEIIINLQENSQGYYTFLIKNFEGISILGGTRCSFIHRIVALYFVDNLYGFEVVNHIDGNKLNNNDWNLEWCTKSHNSKHAWNIGLVIGKETLVKSSDISRINELLRNNKSYKEVEEELGISIGYIKNRKYKQSKNPSDFIHKIINDNTSKMFSNANIEFVEEINSLIREGKKNKEITEKLNLPKTYISDIRKMKKFKGFHIMKPNKYKKLSDEKCIQIIEEYNNNTKIADIAKKYEIDISMIYRIKKRKGYENLPIKFK